MLYFDQWSLNISNLNTVKHILTSMWREIEEFEHIDNQNKNMKSLEQDLRKGIFWFFFIVAFLFEIRNPSTY